jgi:hypothetical protein
MKEFSEYQRIWETGSLVIKDTTGSTVPFKLTEKLKQLEKSQNRANKIKIITVAVLVTLFIYILFQNTVLVVSFIGMGIIFTGILFFIVLYLKNQLTIQKLDFTADSKNFSDQTLSMLNKQNSIFRIPFFVFIFLMITGSNLLLMGLGEPDGNLSAYLYNTALILLFAAIGYWVRMKRIKKEIAPIIEELTDFKANMITE